MSTSPNSRDRILEIVAPDTKWRERLFKLLETRSEEELRMMGFTGNWRSCPFWKPWLPEASNSDGGSGEDERDADA